MQCHECGRPVARGDRFCTSCGASLTGITDATELIDTIEPDVDATAEVDTVDDPPDADEPWNDTDPVWAATGPVETIEASDEATRPIGTVRTDQLPATEPVTEVWMDATAEPVAEPAPPPAAATTTMPSVDGRRSTVEMPIVQTPIRERRQFRPTAVLGLSLVGGAVAMVAMFANLVSVSSDERIIRGDATPAAFRTGSWIADDLADNLSIAALVAVALLVAGGVASAFQWRGGSGLAGGAGLAIAGIAALTIGLAQIPIDAAYEMAAIPTDQRFTLTITRDLGYWLLIAAGALGVIAFFASLNDTFGDRRSGLNPWIAAVGALAGLVFAGGPLLPEGLGVLSDNIYVNEGPGQPPAMLLTGRLIQLGLLAFTSVAGFLSVRRWGLGVAVGGALPAVWMVISSLLDLTSDPVGPGFANPGGDPSTIHGVTIIGAAAVAAFCVLAVIAALDQARHEW